MKNSLVVFAAGCLGGLVMCVVMWLFSRYGITQSLNVQLAGSVSPHWMYPRIVWGGLWGFLFLLPIFASSIFARSFVIALIPTLIQLFVFYPFYEGKGVAGFSLGLLTPFLVFFFFWIWSLTTTITLRLSWICGSGHEQNIVKLYRMGFMCFLSICPCTIVAW